MKVNILNGTEAFAAMSAGQKIECRHGSSDLDFDDIRNFPATVFIDPDYDFRIAVTYMMIGTMQVPEAINEAPAKGTQCFTPSVLTEELSKSFKWKNSSSDLVLLERGLVHLYEESATTHAKALITISHGAINKPGIESSADDLPWNDVAEEKSSTSQSEIEIISQGKVTAAEESLTEFKAEEAPKRDLVHEALLEDLLNRAAVALTPAEANALVGYTRMWTEEQRKPLLDAIHKRLSELNPPEQTEIKEPPSLMVRIQNTQNEHELNELLPEIRSRHPDIQPKLMGYVKQRRFELENAGSEVAS